MVPAHAGSAAAIAAPGPSAEGRPQWRSEASEQVSGLLPAPEPAVRPPTWTDSFVMDSAQRGSGAGGRGVALPPWATASENGGPVPDGGTSAGLTDGAGLPEANGFLSVSRVGSDATTVNDALPSHAQQHPDLDGAYMPSAVLAPQQAQAVHIWFTWLSVMFLAD